MVILLKTMKILKVISLLLLLSTNGFTMAKDHCVKITGAPSLLTQLKEPSAADEPSDNQCNAANYQFYMVYTLHESNIYPPVPCPSRLPRVRFETSRQLGLWSESLKPQLIVNWSRPYYIPDTYIQIQSFLL